MRQVLLDVLPPLLAVALVVGSVLAARSALADRARSRRSVRASGTVVSIRRTLEQQWFPLVRFRTAAGQDVEAEPSSTSNLGRFQVGQPVGLRYDPADPTWIQVDGLPSGVAVEWGASAVLALAAAACLAVTLVRR